MNTSRALENEKCLNYKRRAEVNRVLFVTARSTVAKKDHILSFPFCGFHLKYVSVEIRAVSIWLKYKSAKPF